MTDLMGDQFRSERAERGRGLHDDVIAPENGTTNNSRTKAVAPIKGIDEIDINNVRRKGVVEGEQLTKLFFGGDIQQTSICERDGGVKKDVDRCRVWSRVES